jgi:hypothetical protein
MGDEWRQRQSINVIIAANTALHLLTLALAMSNLMWKIVRSAAALIISMFM